MDVFGTLPVWAQLLIAVLVAGVMIVMNLGWLLQARGWLNQQKRRRAEPDRTSSPTSTETTPQRRV